VGYETENSAAPWALRLGKELYFTFYLQLDLEIEHRLKNTIIAFKGLKFLKEFQQNNKQ